MNQVLVVDDEAAMRAALEAKRVEIGELERLRDDMSESIGGRTRWFLAMIMGLMWTAFPLGGIANIIQ